MYALKAAAAEPWAVVRVRMKKTGSFDDSTERGRGGIFRRWLGKAFIWDSNGNLLNPSMCRRIFGNLGFGFRLIAITAWKSRSFLDRQPVNDDRIVLHFRCYSFDEEGGLGFISWSPRYWSEKGRCHVASTKTGGMHDLLHIASSVVVAQLPILYGIFENLRFCNFSRALRLEFFTNGSLGRSAVCGIWIRKVGFFTVL